MSFTMRRLPLVLLALLICSAARAQDCTIPFTTPLFDVQVENDIWYGNAVLFNGSTDSLRLNLYKPSGDGQTERPLVILIHGGGFVDGNRSELNDVCNTLASMGWAAATISYRLGFYGTGLVEPPYIYDPNEFRRAVHRAMQDAKGAIRTLKGRQAQDSTSTANVLLLGFSAGAITALHAAYLDTPDERPAATQAIGDVQHFLTFYPRPDLGGIEGSIATDNGEDASVLGVVNIFGALMDTTYIGSSNDPALYSYHQTLDPVVGCGVQRPYWGIGLGVPDNYPWIHGSCSINNRISSLGFAPGRYAFNLHNGNEHAVHDPAGVLLESLSWMRSLFCSTTTSVADRPAVPSVTIFPNPTIGVVRIGTMEPSLVSVELLDATGRSLASPVTALGAVELDLSTFGAGLYLLRITSGERVSVRTLIRE